MSLIKTLHEREGLLRGVAVFFVRIPLQLGQVVGGGRSLKAINLFDLGEHTALAPDGVGDLLGGSGVGEPRLTLAVFIKSGVFAEIRLDGEVILRSEAQDILLAAHYHGEGRGLHSAGGELGVVLAGQGAGDVQPDEPICLGSALSAAV